MSPRVGVALGLTRQAPWAGLVLMAMVAAAVNYQSNASWLLVSLLGAALAVSALHARRVLGPVAAVVEAEPLACAGDAASLALRVVAGGCPGLRLRQAGAGGPRGGVAPAADGRCVLALAPRSRGLWPLPAISLETEWPLGVFVARRRQTLAGELVVHPRPAGAPLSAALARSAGPRPGTAGEGDDFQGLRPWQRDDSPRHIDWKAAERGAGLQVKVWRGEAPARLRLDWVQAAGGTEERLSQLALWIEEAERQGLAWSLHLPGVELPVGGGAIHRRAGLRALAAWGPRP